MALGRNHKIFNIGNASGTIQGLTRVYHDLSLSGDGTLSSLLGVVGDKADEEVNQYVYDNSATIDNVNTSYQTNSGTFLTAIPDYYATTGDINDLAQSISETYQVKGDYVERNAMDSAIEFATSGKLNASSFASVSGDFLVASSLNGYATESFVEETSGAITSLIPTNYYPDTNPSSFVNEDWVTAQGYITGVDLTPYATKTELGDYQTTAGMIDYAKASALENLENDYESLSSNINSNSGVWNDITAYQNASGTYLTGISIPESATWNDVSITVQTNSADWASHQDLSYISAQVDNKLDSSSFVPSDFYPMTGNPSGFLTAHQDWTDTITAASANAYNEAIAQIPAPFDPTYISGVIDNKLNTTAFSEVSGSFLTAVSIPESADWEDATNTYQSHSGTYLTAVDLSNYYTKSETSGADELANAFANIPAGDSEVNSYVHNNSATIDDVNSTVHSNSANWGQGGVTYSAGEYIDITDDTISVTGVTDLVAGNAITITTSGTSAIISSNGEAQVQSDWNVTDSNSKAYIRNKPTIPAAQIQSDWNQTNTNAKDYIKNKPSIPRYTGASGINVSSNIVSLDNPIGLIAGDNITITVSGTSAIVSAANQGGNPEVESYVQTNSANIDETVGYVKTNSAVLTGMIDGKQDTLTFGYDEQDRINSINNSALAGGGVVPEDVMVEPNLEYNAVNEISGYNGSAIAQYGAEKQWLVHDDTLVHAANSAQYALGVNVSAVAQLLGLDETVLWSGNANTGTLNLTEPLTSFKEFKFYVYIPERGTNQVLTYYDAVNTVNPGFLQLTMSTMTNGSVISDWWQGIYNINGTVDTATYKSFSIYANGQYYKQCSTTACGTNDSRMVIKKIIGIGRKA